MIGVVAKLTIADGKHAEFEEAAKDLMAKVKGNEPGTLTYQLYKSKSDPNVYIFMEQYASEAALKAHGTSDYFAIALHAIGNTAEGVSKPGHWPEPGMRVCAHNGAAGADGPDLSVLPMA